MCSDIFSQSIKYNINGMVLQLPADHPLEFFQSKYKRYDRFLPFLVKRLLEGNGVIDVGANCGDTLAAIIPHGPQLSYIAIDPSENFFNYLTENLKTIQQSYPATNIIINKSAVGNDSEPYILSEEKGTAKAIKGVNSNASTFLKIKLTKLIASLSIEFKPRLIKIDTDGFDYDVLNSGLDLINEHKPILFFECNPESQIQLIGYLDTLKKLEQLNYKNFYIFDNFGEFILNSSDINQITNLIRYFLNQSTRTFYYIDILAVVTPDTELADAAINEYNQTKF
jgi:FkbM family methyltransferase